MCASLVIKRGKCLAPLDGTVSSWWRGISPFPWYNVSAGISSIQDAGLGSQERDVQETFMSGFKNYSSSCVDYKGGHE